MKKISYNTQTAEITESTLSTTEEDAYKAAAVEEAKVLYKYKRRQQYPSTGDQLDLLYKDLLAGKVDATGEWVKAIKKIKDDNPKP